MITSKNETKVHFLFAVAHCNIIDGKTTILKKLGQFSLYACYAVDSTTIKPCTCIYAMWSSIILSIIQCRRVEQFANAYSSTDCIVSIGSKFVVN